MWTQAVDPPFTGSEPKRKRNKYVSHCLSAVPSESLCFCPVKMNGNQTESTPGSECSKELCSCGTISMYWSTVPNWTLEDLGFNLPSFTNSITLGKSLNFAGSNFLICKNWEQVDLDYMKFQVPSNSITMTSRKRSFYVRKGVFFQRGINGIKEL